MLDMDLVIVAGTTIILSTMGMIYSLIRRRIDRGGPTSSDFRELRELSQRLERIEQGVDAVAVEVERISEAQRYTTRLLGDRAPERAAERVR